MPKFPHIVVPLVGLDGNAFSILGRVQKALRSGGVSKKDIDAYMKEAMDGDYNHLLRVTMDTISIQDEDEDEDEDYMDEDDDDYDDDDYED